MNKEIAGMAFDIADKAAPELIVSDAIPVTIDGETWYDLDTNSGECSVRRDCKLEIEYCERRGLFRHHPRMRHLVQPLEDK
jgi:hypothetical protein